MKKTILLTALLGTSVSLGAGLVAVAQNDGPPPHHRFGGGHHGGPGGFGEPGKMMDTMLEELDLNEDGQISKAELDAKENAAFADIDTNGDGFAAAEEMAAFHERKREEMRLKMMAAQHQRMVDELDTNGDGRISQTEFTARPNPVFDKADTNGDGVVDASELEKARASGKEKFERFRQWKDKRGEGRGFRQ